MIEDLPSEVAGQEKFDVEFDVDAFERLTVEIISQSNYENRKKVLIENKQGSLPPEEVQRLIQDAKIRRGEKT